MYNLAKVIFAMNKVGGSTAKTEFDPGLRQVEKEALKSLSGLLQLTSGELAVHLEQGGDPTEWMITPPVKAKYTSVPNKITLGLSKGNSV